MVKKATAPGSNSRAAQQQQLSPCAGGTVKPNRPPTEYEVRVYKVLCDYYVSMHAWFILHVPGCSILAWIDGLHSLWRVQLQHPARYAYHTLRVAHSSTAGALGTAVARQCALPIGLSLWLLRG